MPQRLGDSATEGQHGQAAVLQLLQFHLLGSRLTMGFQWDLNGVFMGSNKIAQLEMYHLFTIIYVPWFKNSMAKLREK